MLRISVPSGEGCASIDGPWPPAIALWPAPPARRGRILAYHSHPDFGQLEPGEARRELETSREQLRRVLDAETDEFAIPLGQSSNWTQAAGLAAAEAGYTTVYAQCVNTRPEGTIERTFITRIDRPVLFRAALAGAYDDWEEWC